MQKLLPVLIIAFIISSNLSYSQSAYSTPYEYGNQPVYQPDVAPVYDALKSKQSSHNSRVNQLEQKMDDITRLLLKVKERKGGFTVKQRDYINWFADEWSKVLKWDFSNTQNFNNVMSWLRKAENTIIDWL